MTNDAYLAAEARARVEIDRQLAACGWVVQDRAEMNLYAGQGVAVREFIMAPGHGRADYLLFVDGKAVGAIEAKPSGTPLAGVEPQSAKYAAGLPDEPHRAWSRPLPFLYESTGDETMFTDGFDPDPRVAAGVHVPSARDARPVAATLASTTPTAGRCGPGCERLGPVGARGAAPHPGRGDRPDRGARWSATIRGRWPRWRPGRARRSWPRTSPTGWSSTPAPSGSCSSSTGPTSAARRCREFQQFATPGDGRKFTELYNVQLPHLEPHRPGGAAW